jgi:cytochrome c
MILAAAIWAGSAFIGMKAGAVVTALRAAGPSEVAQDTGSKRSVWDGVYSDAQAKRGQELYREQCAGCHLESLGGADMAPALAGDSFRTQWNDLLVADLFDRIRISMPQDTPASLSRQAYVDIVAHILKANNFPAGDTDLDHDIAALKQIKILTKRPVQN